ncbi:hypothetical protein CDL15_Pgr006678 [Punica granatum]|uniref:Uncharacterized protein n=1 Tax=Punica granatum TaxID=22663 RepID=A0A218X778_PUNGR|nr:hypothetical protein CDL15_Pgr006678 [Punica granatum]PKI45923.1 hypothetical protein CRG98_033722 [Punica granatum]
MKLPLAVAAASFLLILFGVSYSSAMPVSVSISVGFLSRWAWPYAVDILILKRWNEKWNRSQDVEMSDPTCMQMKRANLTIRFPRIEFSLFGAVDCALRLTRHADFVGEMATIARRLLGYDNVQIQPRPRECAVDLPRHVDVTASRRELKENSFGHHPEHKSNAGDMDLDDYHRIDPSPSSKAIQPGPIQHGTPLMPFIPEPSPPSPPAPG